MFFIYANATAKISKNLSYIVELYYIILYYYFSRFVRLIKINIMYFYNMYLKCATRLSLWRTYTNVYTLCVTLYNTDIRNPACVCVFFIYRKGKNSYFLCVFCFWLYVIIVEVKKKQWRKTRGIKSRLIRLHAARHSAVQGSERYFDLRRPDF